MYPNLLFFHPALAAGTVMYRVRGLGWAEKWAAATGRAGARYPWQTEASGKVASVAHGPTSCAEGRDHDPHGCDGDLPQTALGIMDRGNASAGAWIGAMVHEWEDASGKGHESYPSHLVGMNVETAENTFNTSFGASFYQMASMGDGTIVGLGLCCDYGRFGKLGCPQACGLNPPGPIRDASMAMMSWGAANRSTPPRILKTHKVADLGIALVVVRQPQGTHAPLGVYDHP